MVSRGQSQLMPQSGPMEQSTPGQPKECRLPLNKETIMTNGLISSKILVTPEPKSG
jgi:hypothetical protein